MFGFEKKNLINKDIITLLIKNKDNSLAIHLQYGVMKYKNKPLLKVLLNWNCYKTCSLTSLNKFPFKDIAKVETIRENIYTSHQTHLLLFENLHKNARE